MLLSIDIDAKSLGTKQLFNHLTFSVDAKEKLAIIGRNGVGKTTLFRMLTNQEQSEAGEVIFRNGTRIVSTAQEHHDIGDQSALDYIITNLPDYARMKHIIDTYPETMGDDLKKIEAYSNALEHFSSLGYYNIEDAILHSLTDYQIDEEMARAPMKRLSGGQKRFVELVRIEHSAADLALIDEPTNHMDYLAKQSFIEWLKSVKYAVVVISHDRDVLHYVDRIIEIKDGKATSFKGNYDAYLKQNATSTAAQMHGYEVSRRRIENLKSSLINYRRLKEKARDPDTIARFKRLEQKAVDEIEELQSIDKPNFWIDRESAENLNKKVSDNYEKYKSKNIRINKTRTSEGARELLHIDELQLGYTDAPLFSPISFRLKHGDRLQLVGRNGVGKTTLIRAIVDASHGARATTWRAGSIFTDGKLRLSVYDQEVDTSLLSLNLAEAIEQTYHQLEMPVTDELVKRIMSDYLFNPYEDGHLPVSSLSGGQKARLQIIKMLANNPNLLVLDEPTNHLDLPSIEELENALTSYHGALLFVSHDSYFAKNLGGETLVLQPANG
ncbi:MAG TPA: ABC-F family ATP-binding cassette domain-containing protein [Candidatus Saccharimonadales bacterium]|nr:ABC-F family ATP-binding cassette domain-containing protein [Candidatus Saccharimonadales bacterium]